LVAPRVGERRPVELVAERLENGLGLAGNAAAPGQGAEDVAISFGHNPYDPAAFRLEHLGSGRA
jgi:hypothetical protein